MSREFAIEITSQGWIDDDEFSLRHDLCSHGGIRLVVGGEVVCAGDDEREYTISTSALQLLRTLESDHVPGWPHTERLVLCCGMLSMASCPIGVDWRVTHLDGRVRIEDVFRADVRGEARFPGLAVELPLDEYRRQIVAFAEKAKEPFAGVQKDIDEDDYDLVLYGQFWDEYDRLLAQYTDDSVEVTR